MGRSTLVPQTPTNPARPQLQYSWDPPFLYKNHVPVRQFDLPSFSTWLLHHNRLQFHSVPSTFLLFPKSVNFMCHPPSYNEFGYLLIQVPYFREITYHCANLPTPSHSAWFLIEFLVLVPFSLSEPWSRAGQLAVPSSQLL